MISGIFARCRRALFWQRLAYIAYLLLHFLHRFYGFTDAIGAHFKKLCLETGAPASTAWICDKPLTGKGMTRSLPWRLQVNRRKLSGKV